MDAEQLTTLVMALAFIGGVIILSALFVLRKNVNFTYGPAS